MFILSGELVSHFFDFGPKAKSHEKQRRNTNHFLTNAQWANNKKIVIFVIEIGLFVIFQGVEVYF